MRPSPGLVNECLPWAPEEGLAVWLTNYLSFQAACGNLVMCALRNSGRSKYRLLGNKLRKETRRGGEIYIKDNFCKKWKSVHLGKTGLIIIS